MSKIITRGFLISKTRTGAIPVWITEIKSYLQIDTEDHDDLLSVLLKSAIDTVEAFCGVSIIQATIKVSWQALGTSEELPYGPVREIVTSPDNADINGYVPGFVVISGMTNSAVEVEYKAGYPDIPEDLKLSVMKLVLDNFEQRTGFSMAGREAVQILPNNWKDTAKKHRRITWLG